MIKLSRRQTEALRDARARSHWLSLSAESRTCLDSIPANKWPEALSKADSRLLLSVARVCREREACQVARARMEEVREHGKGGFGPLVKGFIVGCAQKVGALPVSVVGIFECATKRTLHRGAKWLKP